MSSTNITLEQALLERDQIKKNLTETNHNFSLLLERSNAMDARVRELQATVETLRAALAQSKGTP